MPISHREILGVKPGATAAEVKRAYRVAAGRTHPDRGGSPEEFRKVRAAYEALKDGVPNATPEAPYFPQPDLGKIFEEAFFNFTKANAKPKCETCKGRGYVTKRNGLFVEHTNCPVCWRT